MSQPVEVAAVDHNTAYLCSQTVHIFRGRVGHDVCAPFKRTTVYRGCKSIVDNQGHAVFMGNLSETLNVEDGAAGVRDGLAKQGLGIWSEGSLNLLVGGLLGDERTVDA